MNEEKTLSYAAQMAMDLYYQNYQSNNDFFGIEHFIYCCKAAYGKLLNDDAEESRKVQFLLTGNYVIELSQDWSTQVTLTFEYDEKLKKYVATLPTTPFFFKNDRMSSAVQDIQPISGCKSFVRSSYDTAWQDCFMPSTEDVIWFLKGDKIIAANATCEMEADVYFIQGLGTDPDKIILPDDGTQLDIVTSVYNVMGTVRDKLQAIDMSNNQNPNKAVQTEIDGVYTNLKTKKA